MIARRCQWLAVGAVLLQAAWCQPASGPTKQIRSTFEVRYIATGAVYLAGGRDDGLQEGFHLTVRHREPGAASLSAEPIATLVVTAITAHSAVCSVESSKGPIQMGDTAQVSASDLATLEAVQQSKTARRYGQVVSFSEGDPIDQELRSEVPKPPLPEINRTRGRVSYEFDALRDNDAGLTTVQNAVVLRMDMTRIAGSYWNFTGYYRGRIDSSTSGAAQAQTVRDLLNRTYHLGFFYNNPESKYTIGVGRLFVPWATSLNTIDGGYIGRSMTRHITLATFAGSTPDPTAWDYQPGREIAGSLVNYSAGSFENVRLSSTAGLAVTRLHWKADREYAFFENNFQWKQVISVYHNLEADRLTPGRFGNTQSGVAIARSFLTVRVQPRKWLAIDVNHNYFRTIPSFDTLLLGTGLLDNFLFSGFSAGLRADVSKQITLYSTFGRSNRTGDSSSSLNQMYGVTFRDVYHTGVRADIRRSEFNGAFGKGWYQSVSLSRNVGERLQFDITGGTQEFLSTLTNNSRGFWVNGNADWFVIRHYILGGGVNLFLGNVQNYDQVFSSIGYRF